VPRPRKPAVDAVPAPAPAAAPTRSLVASSTRYPGKGVRIYTQRQDWQRECYRHYAICGEARYGARFFGHAVSRAVLGTATLNPDHEVEPLVSGPAADALDELFDGPDGQVQMLDAMGVHLTIAGECYLVGRHLPTGDLWEVLSCLEVNVTGDAWQINYGNGTKPIDLTEDDVVIRIWLSAPGQHIEADSPFRSLLPILAEIEWLTRHVFAQITSRLAGAGILIMPQGMSFPPAPGADGAEQATANEADAFMLTLADAMLTPINDPGSPAATVPIVVTAPDDAIDKPRLLQFWSELDAHSMELRSEAIRRFALGMDLPPEQMLGMGSNGGTGGGSSNGVSHWGAWQIEESTIKLHVEPMLDTIVNALTMGYLRPAVGDGEQSVTAFVTYTTERLRLRPDRSKEAFELYDRGLLSAKALIRENGFVASDMPDPDEFRQWLLIKAALGSTTPDQVQAAMSQLGVVLGPPPAQAQLPRAQQPRQERPAPSLEDHPTRPRTPGESALVAASEALVFRALERAGNRLRQQVAKPPGVPAYETHLYVSPNNGQTPRLLEDAWSCAPQVLAGIADPAVVVPLLNSYCQSLISGRQAHERSRLRNWLTLSTVDQINQPDNARVSA
jgi:hypothetical protein